MATMKAFSSNVTIGPAAELYLRDVDRTLLRRNLALTHQQRLEQLQQLARFSDELRRAGNAARPNQPA